MKAFIYKHRYGLSSFFLPILIMTIIFIFQSVYPFGEKTLFTIDLGQQYIDFFAEFKHTLSDLNNWDRLIYSFNKGLGGEMTGIWAYYLMSPLNIIFLFLPHDHLDLAVTLLILLRYGLAGLSMSIYLRETKKTDLIKILILSTSYALSGYMVNYQFNLMWIDGIILLPIICLGLDRLMKGQSPILYSLSLGLAMISNYYIAFMICLFLTLYFFYRLPDSLSSKKGKTAIHLLIKFSLFSLLAVGLAAFILVPTYLQLQQSKIDHAAFSWDFSPKYPIQDILSKFVIASFNFDQLPDGLPNIFVSAFVLIQVFRYFFNSHFHWTEKLRSGLFISVLLLSLNLDALNKVWHGFQNPIWFPYRFSFVFIFLLLILAYRQMSYQEAIKNHEWMLGLGLSLISLIYLFRQDFDYLNSYKIGLSFILIVVYFILISVSEKKMWQAALFSLAILIMEVTANASLSISELDYVDRNRFVSSQKILNEMVNFIEEKDPSQDEFYRIEKTFQRTKNDSHQVDYKSASHFGSTYEARSHELFSGLGLPAGSGFSAYSNGTLFTDALFGIKYYVSDNEVNLHHPEQVHNKEAETALPMSIVQSKPDLAHYDLIYSGQEYSIFENPYAFSLAFKVHENIADIEMVDNYPMVYQNQIIQNLSSHGESSALFLNFPVSQHFENIKIEELSGERIARPIDPGKKARLEAHFKGEEGQSYYYILNGFNDWENYEIKVNGKALYQYNTIYDDVVVNLEPDENQDIRLSIELLDESFYLSHSGFFSLDHDDFESVMNKVQEEQIKIENYDNGQVSFQTTIDQEDEIIMLTLPYDSSWQVKANGEEVEALAIMDRFMGLDLEKGSYQIEMTYQAPYAKSSGICSLASALFLLGYSLNRKQARKKDK